jgi:hypothetical protein
MGVKAEWSWRDASTMKKRKRAFTSPVPQQALVVGEQKLPPTQQIASADVFLDKAETIATIAPRYAWECAYSANRMVNIQTGESVSLNCKSWRCPVHGPRLQTDWFRRVGAANYKLMWTFTLIPTDKARARRIWQELIRWMRRQGVEDYIKVLEFGEKSGMRHWHVLTTGADYVDIAGVELKCLELGIGSKYGRGLDITRVWQGQGAADYLLKYTTKQFGVRDPRRIGWKAITCSRSFRNMGYVRKLVSQNQYGDHESESQESWRLIR